MPTIDNSTSVDIEYAVNDGSGVGGDLGTKFSHSKKIGRRTTSEIYPDGEHIIRWEDENTGKEMVYCIRRIDGNKEKRIPANYRVTITGLSPLEIQLFDHQGNEVPWTIKALGPNPAKVVVSAS